MTYQTILIYVYAHYYIISILYIILYDEEANINLFFIYA